MLRTCLLVLATLAVVTGTVGCAGYRIEANGQGVGYDVYAPEPYLLATPKVVETDAAKVLVYDFTLVWLPNYSRRYRVSSWAAFGKASFTFEFKDGWQLTKIQDESDNTAVFEQLVGLVKHVLPTDPFAIASGKTAAGPGPQSPTVIERPILYRIEYDDSGRAMCLKQLDANTTSTCATMVHQPVPCVR